MAIRELRHLALISETNQLPMSELTVVSAALQKQVLRDFFPVWEIQATVDAFENLEDVPTTYWPVIVRDDIGFPGAAGIHLDEDFQPFSLVQFNNRWTLTASHEVLEMLADPFGNRLHPSQSIKSDQGRVEYLVEVCDPSEAWEFGYNVNGVRMSDFYTPEFFSPVSVAGSRYSFTGALTEARQVISGGYISWRNPEDGHWWQQIWFGDSPEFRDLGVLTAAAGDFRSQIDQKSMRPEVFEGRPKEDKGVRGMATLMKSYKVSTSAKATSIRKQINMLKQKYAK